MKPLPFLLLVVTGAWATASGAQPPSEPEPGAAARYEQTDTDHDGRISREEFAAGVANKRGWWALGRERANTGQNSATPEMFAAIDRDRDGFLSMEELEAGRRLRESRGDNGFGASGSRSNRPAPTSQAAGHPREEKDPARREDGR